MIPNEYGEYHVTHELGDWILQKCPHCYEEDNRHTCGVDGGQCIGVGEYREALTLSECLASCQPLINRFFDVDFRQFVEDFTPSLLELDIIEQVSIEEITESMQVAYPECMNEWKAELILLKAMDD